MVSKLMARETTSFTIPHAFTLFYMTPNVKERERITETP
jgi:hypothetical protein